MSVRAWLGPLFVLFAITAAGCNDPDAKVSEDAAAADAVEPPAQVVAKAPAPEPATDQFAAERAELDAQLARVAELKAELAEREREREAAQGAKAERRRARSRSRARAPKAESTSAGQTGRRDPIVLGDADGDPI